jgi:hypothetical protein
MELDAKTDKGAATRSVACSDCEPVGKTSVKLRNTNTATTVTKVELRRSVQQMVKRLMLVTGTLAVCMNVVYLYMCMFW